jgi:hypothetical protein
VSTVADGAADAFGEVEELSINSLSSDVVEHSDEESEEEDEEEDDLPGLTGVIARR